MNVKKLKLFKDGEHFQTVTFEKVNSVQGWIVTHHNHDAYLPFQYYDMLSTIKEKLIDEGIYWVWE